MVQPPLHSVFHDSRILQHREHLVVTTLGKKNKERKTKESTEEKTDAGKQRVVCDEEALGIQYLFSLFSRFQFSMIEGMIL